MESTIELREVLGDQDLWSLLNGYGPGQHARPVRNASDAQRWQIVRDRLAAMTEGLSAMDDVRLVLEIRHPPTSKEN